MKHGRMFLFSLSAVLGGCAASSQTVLPSGAHGYSINCSGAALTWAQCYEKAGSLCPSGYNIVEQSGQTPGTVAGAGPQSFFATPIVDRTMLVQCKTSKAQ